MMRKILSGVVLAFVAFYAVTNPAESAGLIRSVAHGVGTFASALAGGDR